MHRVVCSQGSGVLRSVPCLLLRFPSETILHPGLILAPALRTASWKALRRVTPPRVENRLGLDWGSLPPPPRFLSRGLQSNLSASTAQEIRGREKAREAFTT